MNAKEVIRNQLEQAFHRKSWHGTDLSGAIRGIDDVIAEWRPAPDRHNIRELIVHAAYWKYSVCRRLIGDPKAKFDLPGSNWIGRPASSKVKDDARLLKSYHKRLMAAFDAFPEDCLQEIPAGSSTTFLDLLVGVAAHDLYHAGQIQLIKRLHSGD